VGHPGVIVTERRWMADSQHRATAGLPPKNGVTSTSRDLEHRSSPKTIVSKQNSRAHMSLISDICTCRATK
jgi:hypothetical protein